MIAIIDYGMGNLRSVYNALDMIGGDPEVVSNPAVLDDCERIVLPGVGAFGDCIVNLTRSGFKTALDRAVLDGGKPILGICLGMQVMAEKGYEFGEHDGLGWFEGVVRRIDPGSALLRVPQVGWNDIEYTGHPLFEGLPAHPDVYFVHSYQMQCRLPEHVVATCSYGETITAAVARDNIVATQFHPEKSQDFGLQVLENFIRWRP